MRDTNAIENVEKKVKEQRTSHNPELIENWLSLNLWPSLHAYLTSQSLPASAKIVAKKFDVTLEEAYEAVEGLKNLGLLYVDNNRYKAKKMNFLLTRDDLSSEQILKYHLLKTKDMLTQTNMVNIRQGHTHIIATDEACIEWFNREYRKLIDRLYKKSKPIKEGGIYNIASNIMKTSSLDKVNEKGDRNENK